MQDTIKDSELSHTLHMQMLLPVNPSSPMFDMLRAALQSRLQVSLPFLCRLTFYPVLAGIYHAIPRLLAKWEPCRYLKTRCACYLLAIHLYRLRYQFSSQCPRSLSRVEHSANLGSHSLPLCTMHALYLIVEVFIIHPYRTSPSLFFIDISKEPDC